MSRARAFMTSGKEAGEPMFAFLRPKHMSTFDCKVVFYEFGDVSPAVIST